MPRLCPDHQCELDTKTIHGIEVDICPRCGGIWLDKGEIVRMRKLTAEKIEHFEQKPTGALAPVNRVPKCPICAKPLEAFRYASGAATLGTCPELHGLWVPEPELEKIVTMQTPKAQARLAEATYRAQSEERAKHMYRASSAISIMNTQVGFWPAFWSMVER